MSDDCCTTSIEYAPPRPVPAVLPDLGSEFPWLLIIPFLILLAAVIYLMALPAPKKDPPKTVREQINSAFDAINQEANLYNRSYVVGPLEKARKKVIEILDKESVK